uniref:Uncharacterized protein n=1 Tax=Timema poppense TaxID=170557 RepID=A0A7R9H913_TIMPO|nr:unnamed protein product [Timema poppensis]
MQNVLQFTGFVTVRVGKAAAFAVGGSVLLLQVAHHQGYIKVNWDKVYKHVDKVADKVEKEATGQSPKWMEKATVYHVSLTHHIFQTNEIPKISV